jgi:hypothetical protein
MNGPKHKKRRSRDKPDPSAYPQPVIRERDREILRLVYEHRFLDRVMLWHLLHRKTANAERAYRLGRNGKMRPTTHGFGEKALAKRLTQLIHARYLDRRFLHDEPVGRGYGSHRSIYCLGPKSVPLLSKMTGATPRELRRIIERNKVQPPFLRHALGIARFRVILELACERSEERVRLLFWEQGQVLKDRVVGENLFGEDDEFPVHPDAFFGLEVKGKGRTHFFLEYDRGTEPIMSARDRTTIYRKVFGLRYYRASDQFKQRYAYKTLPDGQIVGLDILPEKHSRRVNVNDTQRIGGFQVLFVTPGKVEADGKVSGRIANILAELPKFGSFYSRTALFWFTHPEAFTLEQPETLFQKIWITPNPKDPLQSLIED